MSATQSSLRSIDNIRSEFPATKKYIYMDVANQGLISRTTLGSFEKHLQNRLSGVNDELFQLREVERTRARFGSFIGADANEIAITKNASEGINILANAFDWKAGDNVILCPQLEHANNILPWLQIRKKFCIELRTVESVDGSFPVEAAINSIDRSTRIVALSTVTMVPGYRTMMRPISDACRSNGTFLLADGTQSVGILDTNVDDLGVDGLSVSTVKGLMGLYGSGFLYCRRDWAEQLEPAYLTRFSIDLGDAPESAPILDIPKLRAGSPRFDVGHYNFPGLIAVDSSIHQLAEIGTDVIDAHVTKLAERLSQGLMEMGLPVCHSSGGHQPGSIVAVGDVGTALGKAEPAPMVRELHNFLLERNVAVSVRRGLLRFSLHVYNTSNEVDQVLDFSSAWLKKA
ncbi:aminotransferase class V-fold PLP-dependent enzyme [Sinorhizobium prairiense]|uniref:aminotransferase class V-fold PLP-dependent enzyme n=1 Tax=unclassified Sinorhizobium TaxID=2613772 RepID=UPI0023D8745F|nr:MULTISPECIES: aminotransferase class V-fold PLP-dependent enzyme [unclassified Sinorhizobium]WEJ08611.1 aminotransferase class V-fold PLP-dependent enzyme [Sinorhizobium sp. M103]WEJ13888.1 aminotransferase class V-fold PLP-dependent enzyme [Sinorhizobium sp. K101]WEJ35486.1 aminotransferase class V-fold PLP-dependent enzyme [Sinorhizobium sp. C101]